MLAADGDDLVKKGSEDTAERKSTDGSEETRREEMGPWGQQERSHGMWHRGLEGQMSHVISSIFYVKQEARPSAEIGEV